MLVNMFHGFCMALADSVPGVSGGTIAFILGFYDRFLNALHDLFSGTAAERKAALCYLVKLGLGWVVGMGLAATALAQVFESGIYVLSSAFLGLTIASLPFIIREERSTLAGRGALSGFHADRDHGCRGAERLARGRVRRHAQPARSAAVAVSLSVPGRRACHHRDGPARHFRLDPAAGVRRLYAGHLRAARADALSPCCTARADRIRVRCTVRHCAVHSLHPAGAAAVPPADGLSDYWPDARLAVCDRHGGLRHSLSRRRRCPSPRSVFRGFSSALRCSAGWKPCGT